MLNFILGFVIGAFFGFVVACCLVVSGKEDHRNG